MPYCSSSHISQPPGMLPAARHNPTFVPGFRRKPSTAGIRSAPDTTNPSSAAAFSTIGCEAAVEGMMNVPAGCPSKAAPARKTGTAACCSAATSLNTP
jgi:hypothetical protein